jgi:hypothetical protein
MRFSLGHSSEIHWEVADVFLYFDSHKHIGRNKPNYPQSVPFANGACVNHNDQHHQHRKEEHEHERKEKKHEERERRQHSDRIKPLVKPVWLLIGGLLLIAVIVVWTLLL